VLKTAPLSNVIIAREAHGVVLVIAPWNYPYMTAITRGPRPDRGQIPWCSNMPAQTLRWRTDLPKPSCRGIPEIVLIPERGSLDHDDRMLEARAFKFW